MPVYIDDMHKEEMGRLGRMKMSHMIADSREELMYMARQIGMQPRWIQKRDTAHEHFDVAKGRRAQALTMGAIAITVRQCAMMCRRRAVTGKLGDPADVEEWFRQHMLQTTGVRTVDNLSA